VIIGLTGGIASGKSVVSDELERRGARVIDADVIVHYLSNYDPTVLYAIRESAGDAVFMKHGALDRIKLAHRAFQAPELLRALEKIYHPPVLAVIEANIVAARLANQHLVCVVPLLYEGGYQTLFDQVWVVTVASETQIERLMARGGLSREMAGAMIASQLPLADKELLAGRVLDNNGSLPQLKERVSQLWEEITS
jgi:dephospho-CoA kinase